MGQLSRLAINPLPWILDSHSGFHLDVPSLTAAFEVVAPLGFTAVQADVPAELTVPQYRALVEGYGLASAPGYFGADFDVPGTAPQIIESALRHAASQLELGLSEVFIAANITPARRARPAQGADASAERLSVIVDQIGQVAEAISAEGLTPALHPHVGTWIEVEREVRAVLDGVPSSVLSFGPDTGHLAWAGIDPVALITEYRDRVVAMHIKDVDPAAAATARSAGSDYPTATDTDNVWTEPGRGSVDFDAVFAALPEGFAGWAVLEVDVPNIGTATQSTAESARWLRSQPNLAGLLR